jgi:hypothetical protein
MGKISDALTYGLTIRESADDGSDFTNPAADYRRLFLGEDGQLHVKDPGGTVTGIGSGSGMAHSFAGYNTAGASWQTVTALRYYCKAITLAADSLVASIDCHVRGNTDNINAMSAALAADNATAPGVLIAGSQIDNMYFSNSASMPSAARWFTMPIGAYVAAGTYWLCVMALNNRLDIAYDGSGTDQYFTSNNFLVMGGYPAAFAITTGTAKYSIRASILS